MIEQVFYRRTDQGYSEYRSGGLSSDDAHSVNAIMDKVASNIGDLNSGVDAPFLIYPLEKKGRICLATFEIEYSHGRENSVHHGLLIEGDEYKKLVTSPSSVWGFTNRNFSSRNVHHDNQLPTLNEIKVSIDPELSKDFIFQEYKLNNDGFLKLLNTIYTSLSKKKNYTFGIRIDNSKDANKVMRHFGYLIMSMLPYELRDQISFCSRRAPRNLGVTVQILRAGDPNDTDVIYEVNTRECKIIKKTSIEIENGYLNDLLNMSDDALQKYFAILDEFKGNLNLSTKSGGGLVVSKLMTLSNNPSLFASETVEAQVAFIHDVFSLPTSNTELINSIVVSLLPFVDSGHYMEAFDIGFELYKKLDYMKDSERTFMDQIGKNLSKNYKDATLSEKIQLFLQVSRFSETHIHVCGILESFVDINDSELDTLLVNEYIKIFGVFYDDFTKSVLIKKLPEKICSVFRKSNLNEKKTIWEHVHDAVDSTAKTTLIASILSNKDVPFQREVFTTLVTLYIENNNSQVKQLCHRRIIDVIREEDDSYRLNILIQYKDLVGFEDPLWYETYCEIKDSSAAAGNIEFLKCLKEKYYHSTNPKICDLYLEYLKYIPLSELESIILLYGKQDQTSEREDYLLSKVVCILQNEQKKISFSALKVLAKVVKEEDIKELASYIRNLYLSGASESSSQVYDFLETEQLRLFNSVYLEKETLPSFDAYFAGKLNKSILKNDSNLLASLSELEKLQYHEKSYAKIYSIYQKWIDQEIKTAETDYKRYLWSIEQCRKIDSLSRYQFGIQYCNKLKEQVKRRFWETSASSTFDFEHCEIYLQNSGIYDHRYRNHENYVLAETVGGLIRNSNGNSYVDWDKVYKTLLSKDFIPQDSRKIVISKFENAYKNSDLSEKDVNYIAFANVDKNNFHMNYSKLLEDLQKYNHPIDEKEIQRMKIFKYITISDELRKQIIEHRNFNSDTPSYDEVFKGLFFEQIVVLLLLLINNIVRIFAIDMYGNLTVRGVLLLCNYLGYIILIVGVAVVSILLMNRARMRKSQKNDKYIYSLLVLNMFLSIVAILLSAIFEAWYICLPITIVAMAIAIFLNYMVSNMIEEQKKSQRMRRY